MERLPIRFAAAIVGLAVLAAACTAPGGGATSGPATDPTSEPSSVRVDVGRIEPHGDVLTVDGRAVYLFTDDPAGGTVCLEGCAAAWPPVLVDAGMEPAASAGLDGSLTTFDRPDGGRQVAYEGRALYFYGADIAPGDATGHGVGGVWFLVNPSGAPVGATPVDRTPCTGRYCY